MQGYIEYNIAKRSRYYQSVIDIDSLSKGHSYKDLSNAFVIFICTYDPFKLGMQKYVFEKRCVNAAKELPLNDGVSTVILADNDGDSAINEFYNSLTVQDTSALNPKVYGSFKATSGNSYLVYNFANSNLGIASIGTVKVPLSVEKAKIKAKNCDIFIIEKNSWISAAGFGQAVNIH